MNKPQLPEQKIVFGLTHDEAENLVLLLQVPPGGWEYMKDGTCHTVDLTKLGIPVKVVLTGCADRASAIKIIEQANTARGIGTLYDARNFGIEPKP